MTLRDGLLRWQWRPSANNIAERSLCCNVSGATVVAAVVAVVASGATVVAAAVAMEAGCEQRLLPRDPFVATVAAAAVAMETGCEQRLLPRDPFAATSAVQLSWLLWWPS